jgi:two-component system response regulator YesN
MLKVVIADDERWVCKLIKRSIKWNELGMEVVGESSDGLSAFEDISKYNADIVITDIRMPRLDGISLIKKVKEAGINSNFIIISGYQDFEYAQSALKLGVADYILKPVDEEELMNTLIKLREGILKSKERFLEGENVKRQLTLSIDKLREQFLMRALYDSQVTLIGLEEINSEYQLNFCDGIFQVLVFKIDHRSSKENMQDKELEKIILNKVSETIRKTFYDLCFVTYTLPRDDKVICILNYSFEKTENVEACLKEAYYEVKNCIEKYHQLYLTVGVGSGETQLSLLRQSFKNALMSVKCKLVLGVDRIINSTKLKFNELKLRDLIPVDKEKQFVCLVELFNVGELKAWLSEVFHSVSEYRNIDPHIIYDLCDTVVELFFKVIDNMGFNVDKSYACENEIHEFIDNCKSVGEVQDYITDLLIDSLNYYRHFKEEQSCKPVEVAKDYISKHYHEAISLSDIAGLVYLNANYFSELFKKETGVNFSDYITNFRIEIARELLKDMQYRVVDVAVKVGYRDANYFIKLFKKAVGITPEQYRRLYI